MRVFLILALVSGLLAAQEAERNPVVLDHPRTIQYLNGLAKRLVCPSRTPLSIKVLVDDEADALIAPGGDVYLHTALLRSASNEAELAGVLAHLIAYYNQAPRADLGRYSYRDGLKSSRIAVQRQPKAAIQGADARAVECIYDSGYDPDAFLHLLRRLGDADRAARATAVKSTLTPKRQAILNTDEFAAMVSALENAVAAAPQRNKPPALARQRTPEEDKEKALSERMAAETERHSVLFDDPRTTDYVNRLPQRLVCPSRSALHVKVLVADEPDAVISFGGQVYVNTGLLRQAANEAELAGVLAHLIAYNNNPVQPKHYVPGGPRLYFGPYSWRKGLSTAPLMAQQEGHEAARSADASAVECLHDSGYDPDAYLSALGGLNDPDRLTAAAAVKADLTPKPEYVLDTAGFARAAAAVAVTPAARRLREPPSLARPHRNEHNRNLRPAPNLPVPILPNDD